MANYVMTVTEAIETIIRNLRIIHESESGARLVHAALAYFHSQRHTFSDEQQNEIEARIAELREKRP